MHGPRSLRLDVPIELAKRMRAFAGQFVEYEGVVWILARVDPPGPMDTRSRDPEHYAALDGGGVLILRRMRDERDRVPHEPVASIDPRDPRRVMPWMDDQLER